MFKKIKKHFLKSLPAIVLSMVMLISPTTHAGAGQIKTIKIMIVRNTIPL